MKEMQREDYLKAMGIQVWSHRANVELEPQEASISPSEVDEQAIWQQLREKVAACQACGLHKTRTQTVFGVGNPNAELVVIGEAPGAEEDRRGEPFVGRAGKLLDLMLESIELSRDEVFILNILKCRPPGNRDPDASEVECCTPFLHQQLELLKPKLILAIGRIAAHFLLKCDTALGRLRGSIYKHDSGVPLLVTYHPAYLLRNPRDKGKAFQDLLMVKNHLKSQ